MITVQKAQCIWTIPTQLKIWRWPSQNTFGMCTVLYWTRSSRTQFGVSINVWRLAVDTLNITCKFLCCNVIMYCNHQVHRDFLITLYKNHCWSASWFILPVRARYLCSFFHTDGMISRQVCRILPYSVLVYTAAGVYRFFACAFRKLLKHWRYSSGSPSFWIFSWGIFQKQ
jgi:hypothetical protein